MQTIAWARSRRFSLAALFAGSLALGTACSASDALPTSRYSAETAQPNATAGTSSESAFPDAGGDGSPEGEATSCGRTSGVFRTGCVESTTPVTLKEQDGALTVGSYDCSAAKSGATARIRACASPPDDPCIADEGVTYCAVVEVDAQALASLPSGTEISLDGAVGFTFESHYDYAVRPAGVAYLPANPSPTISRVWMEKSCFCTPIALTGSQTLVGKLRIESATDQRVAGRITLAAIGVISPTTWQTEQHIALDAVFDVPVTVSPN